MNEWLMALPEEVATFYARVAITFVLLLGAIIGSFLNVCIYRIPLEQSVSRPRSHCFSCGKIIPWYYNIPLLSWLMLRGRCAYCKAPISVRYFIVEALTAILFLLVFQMWGNPTLFGLNKLQLPELLPFYWLFVASTVVNVMIDIDHRILLDRISIGGTLLTLAVSAFFPMMQGATVWYAALATSFGGAVAGFALGFAIAWLGQRVFLQDAFGFGDVKWLMLFGALFGWSGCLAILILAAFVGLALGGLTIASQHFALKARKDADALDEAVEPIAIPFGPALGISALLWLFWSNRLVAAVDAAQLWMALHREIVLLLFIPIFLLTSIWLLIRIHRIRKAIRDEEQEGSLEV